MLGQMVTGLSQYLCESLTKAQLVRLLYALKRHVCIMLNFQEYMIKILRNCAFNAFTGYTLQILHV